MLPFHSVKVTPARLFLKRAGSNIRYQIGIIRTAVDWTVALYIVLPALAFAIYQYTLWWHHVPDWFIFKNPLFRRTGPAIFGHLEFIAVLPLLYLAASSASMRYFLEAADQLFVIRFERWYRTQIRLGLLYSTGLAAMTVLLWFAVWGPLIMGTYLSVTISAYIWLAALTMLYKPLLGLLHQWIRLRYAGWRRAALRVLVFASGGLLYIALVSFGWANVFQGTTAILVMAAALYAAGRKRASLQGTFLREAEEERQARLRLVAFMLRGIVEPSKSAAGGVRKLPWMFRRSQRIFRRRTAVNGVTEFVLKAFVRSSVQRRLYLQFVAVMSAALLLSPIWLKYALWLIAAVVLALWMKQMAKELLGTQLLKLFGLQQADRLGALKKATTMLMIPAMMALSLLLGLLITWGTVWYVVISGMLLCAAAGILLGRAAAHMATYFSG